MIFPLTASDQCFIKLNTVYQKTFAQVNFCTQSIFSMVHFYLCTYMYKIENQYSLCSLSILGWSPEV